MSIEQRLRAFLSRAEEQVLGEDVKYAHLYHPGLKTRPLFFFGNLPDAEYVTIGANPSADDFRENRWSLNGDLYDQSLNYFSSANPHVYFTRWEASLTPWELSYSASLAHLDLSPRATKSLGSIALPKEGVEMVEADSKYLFEQLRIVWKNLRCLFVAGTATKRRYIYQVLYTIGRREGFSFQLKGPIPGSSCKAYEVCFGQRSVPLLASSPGPSARKPEHLYRYQQQIKAGLRYLQPHSRARSGS